MGTINFVTSSDYHEPRLNAMVHVTVRANTRSFTARWKDDHLHLTIPPGITPEQYDEVLTSMIPRLQQSRAKQATRFYAGQRFNFAGFTLHIVAGDPMSADISATYSPTEAKIIVGGKKDLDDAAVTASVSRLARRVFGRVAEKILLPRARDIADTLGLNPAGFKISRGLTVLGHCSSTRIIALSSVLVMYPPLLRDYIVCHELAHLSHMDHSPRFHATCDEYCLAICHTSEALLIKMLHNFKKPIP